MAARPFLIGKAITARQHALDIGGRVVERFFRLGRLVDDAREVVDDRLRDLDAVGAGEGIPRDHHRHLAEACLEQRVLLVEIAEIFRRLSGKLVVRDVTSAGYDDGSAVRAGGEFGELPGGVLLGSVMGQDNDGVAAGGKTAVHRIDQRDLGGAQIELVTDILDRVAQRARRLEFETDLAGCESLFAGRLGEDRHAALGDQTMQDLDGLFALRAVEGDLAFVIAQHPAAGAEQKRREHPVVALPAEIDAVDAVAERLDLAAERDDLVPGLRRIVGIAAGRLHEIGVVIHDRIGGRESEAHLLALDLGKFEDRVGEALLGHVAVFLDERAEVDGNVAFVEHAQAVQADEGDVGHFAGADLAKDRLDAFFIGCRGAGELDLDIGVLRHELLRDRVHHVLEEARHRVVNRQRRLGMRGKRDCHRYGRCGEKLGDMFHRSFSWLKPVSL